MVVPVHRCSSGVYTQGIFAALKLYLIGGRQLHSLHCPSYGSLQSQKSKATSIKLAFVRSFSAIVV